MPNSQKSSTERKQEPLPKGAGILARLNQPGIKDIRDESQTSSNDITRPASTEKPSTKTLKLTDFQSLNQMISLIAGYLGEFTKIKRGRAVASLKTAVQPNGKKYTVLQILIGVDEASIEIVESSGELDFKVVEKEVLDLFSDGKPFWKP